jgi:hypothetical protein
MATVKVYLQSLKTQVDVLVSILACDGCSRTMPLVFTTYKCDHTICPSCNAGKCNKCDETQVIPSSPVLMESLKTVPRLTPCGTNFSDIHIYSTHVEGCVRCVRATYTALQKKFVHTLTEHKAQNVHQTNTVTQLRTAADAIKRKLTEVQEQNTKLRKICSFQVAKYEALKQDHAKMKVRRIIIHDDDE